MNGDRCEFLAPLLSAYADDELWGADRDRVGRHLAECGACRATLASYRLMGEALRDAVSAAPARDFSAITWPPRRVLTPPRRVIYHPSRWRDPWPVLAGAAALIAFLVGVQLVRPVARPSNTVEIEQLDSAESVMVIPGDEERMTIIWVFDAKDQTESIGQGPASG